MLWSSNVWHCASQGGDELTDTPFEFRSTISGKHEINYHGDDVEVLVKRTKLTRRRLPAAAIPQVLAVLQ